MRFSNGTLDLRDETITNLAQFWTAIDTFRMDRFDKIESVRLTREQEHCLNDEVRPYMFFSDNVKGNAEPDVTLEERPLIKALMGYTLLIDNQE